MVHSNASPEQPDTCLTTPRDAATRVLRLCFCVMRGSIVLFACGALAAHVSIAALLQKRSARLLPDEKVPHARPVIQGVGGLPAHTFAFPLFQ